MIEYELNESLEGRICEEFGEARFFHGGFKPKGPKMYKSCFGGIKTPYKPVTFSQPNTGFRPMKSTETFVTRLDNLYSGLRSVEKFHPLIKYLKTHPIKIFMG